MRQLLTLAAVVCGLLTVGSPVSAAEEITVPELVSMAAELAGAEIAVVGELVGDYGGRGDGWTWTQLNGDVYSVLPLHEGGEPSGGNIGVGVRIPTDLVVELDLPGGYRNRGPLVRATGVWKYHDPERQGESYLEVQSIELVEPGRRFAHETDWWLIVVGLVLVAAAFAVWLTGPAD